MITTATIQATLRQDIDDGDKLGNHDAQHHDLQVGDDVPQGLLHGLLLRFVGGVFTSGLAHR